VDLLNELLADLAAFSTADSTYFSIALSCRKLTELALTPMFLSLKITNAEAWDAVNRVPGMIPTGALAPSLEA
jgi:hypothetical protein